MTCQRCKGLMVENRFFDLLDSSIPNNPAWRCVICGEVTDMTIVHNRSVQSLVSDVWGGLNLSHPMTEQAELTRSRRQSRN